MTLEPGTPADRHEVIYAVGLIALDFAQLEEVLEQCLEVLKRHYPTVPRLQKLKRQSNFSQKCELFALWAEPFLAEFGIEPMLELSEIVITLRRVSAERNRFIHSAASYFLTDSSDKNMQALTFRFRSHDGTDIEEVIVTNGMLLDMQVFSKGIHNTVWIMVTLLTFMSEAKSRENEWERIKALTQNSVVGE